MLPTMPATKEELQLGQDRRDAVSAFLLDYFTSDRIDTKTLQHFRFVGDIFGVNGVVAELVSSASSKQGREELCVSVIVATLNQLLNSEPPVSERVLKHREAQAEARAAEREFKEKVAGKDVGTSGK